MPSQLLLVSDATRQLQRHAELADELTGHGQDARGDHELAFIVDLPALGWGNGPHWPTDRDAYVVHPFKNDFIGCPPNSTKVSVDSSEHGTCVADVIGMATEACPNLTIRCALLAVSVSMRCGH